MSIHLDHDTRETPTGGTRELTDSKLCWRSYVDNVESITVLHQYAFEFLVGCPTQDMEL